MRILAGLPALLPLLQEKQAAGPVGQIDQPILRADRCGRVGRIVAGNLAGMHRVIGRGKLPGEPVRLRLERTGERVRSLCCANGVHWFTAGECEFAAEGPLQAGIVAMGNIDRAVLPGAFPDGTAIRFRDLRLISTAESAP